MKYFRWLPFFILFLFGLTTTVSAHSVDGVGLVSGLTHPIFGIDHLLAMVAVGIISTQIGGKARWQIPAMFVIFMLIGGITGILGLNLNNVEAGIAFSVLIFGIVIAIDKKISLKIVMPIVALFGILHGHAHGTEIPLIANPIPYSTGFILSTAGLHLFGFFMAHLAQKYPMTVRLLRYTGAYMGVAGLIFLLNL